MDQQTISRHINKRVALDRGVVTYRTLSRELGLTVAEAKTHLGLYAKEPSTAERGVKVTWALSGWFAAVQGKQDDNFGDDKMEVDPSQDQPSPQANEQTTQSKKRAIILCTDDNLIAESSRFSPPPTKHVYALSPSAPTISLLAASSSITQPSTSNAQGDTPDSWKPAPAQGYGTIVHPDGPRKRAPTTKSAKPPPKPTTAPAAAAAAKADVKGKGKEPDAKAKGGMASLFAKTGKAAPAARPIGQLGGLFASRDPPPAKEKEKEVTKKKAVPAKRKAEEKEKEKPKEKAKPVKKVANGMFDEELDDDEDDDVGAEEEEALREMEQESQSKSKAGTSKAEAAKQKKELEAMMASDDDDKMVVDAPPKKEKAPAKAEKKPIKKQATLNFLK